MIRRPRRGVDLLVAWSVAAAVGAIVVAGGAGCVSETKTEDRAARNVRVMSEAKAQQQQAAQPRQKQGRGAAQQAPQAGVPPVPVGPEALDTLTEDQPCGNRMHALAGDMLLYYAVHRQLPPKLDDLRKISDDGASLNFTCPTTGEPYVYAPTGLIYPGKEERLVLYDAEPAHDGTRWGIVAAPPRGERPASAWAVRISEQVFRGYAMPPAVDPPAPEADAAKPAKPAEPTPPPRRPRTPIPLN